MMDTLMNHKNPLKKKQIFVIINMSSFKNYYCEVFKNYRCQKISRVHSIFCLIKQAVCFDLF